MVVTDTETERSLPNVVVDATVQYPSINEDHPCLHEDLHPCLLELPLEKKPLMSKGRILWNLFVLSFSYCLFYTGFWALTNLQSTMNAASGMGPDSQAVIYGFSMLSSLFLPEFCIEKFGCKKVLMVGTILCLPYIASNVHLRWDTMMTASALFGLASGPYGSAQYVYIDEIALRYQATVTENVEFVMACFFGVFTFFMENTQVWGNAISFFVLRSGKHAAVVSRNASAEVRCGIDFNPWDMENSSNANLTPPPDEERFLLIGIFVAMGVLSLFLMGFLVDPLLNDVKPGGCSRVVPRLKASLAHFMTPHQLLLIPLTVFIGMESALYSNEFTEAYIACSWGVHHVGFVTVCFGVCGAAMALLVGPLVKCVSQMAVLLLAAAANAVTCALLFFWNPSPDSVWEYFVFAGVWGMGDAIWWSQVTALYGLMFPNDREAAFSNLYFWSFLGFFLSYSYANYFSVAVKISILLAFLGVGIAGYLVGQIKLKCYSPRHEYLLISDEH